MTATTIEKHKILISYLGEEKVLEIYQLLGNERISFATIKQLILLEKIHQELQNKASIRSVAKRYGIQRSTIYRQLKKSCSF